MCCFRRSCEIVERYMREHVNVRPPADIKDSGFSPYYGWLVEILTEHIHPDTSEGETPEIPLYESSRGPGSTAEVDFWTSREPREVIPLPLELRCAGYRRDGSSRQRTTSTPTRQWMPL